MNGQTTSSATTTTTREAPSTALTWVYQSVTLTYPTVYAAYEEFSYISIEPIATTCVTQTLSLTLPAPTDYAPLIIPTIAIPNPESAPPQLVDYLNSVPTVTEQLEGPIGTSACDPIVGSTRSPDTTTLPDVILVTSVPQLEGTTTITHAEADTEPTSEAPPPPPPSSTPTPTPSTPPPLSLSSTLEESTVEPSSDTPSTSSFAPPESSSATSETPPFPSPGLTSTTPTGTSAIPPTFSSPLPFSGVAAHGKANLGRIERILIGAAGIGLAWI
ncbi:hypothetical protein CC78DRAFT_71073 [Lojkania enalia]|uniref:Uncharacterized protein n=1 Tax=Lojkania enalia TaxID=147567 RepID=A0A9P4K249_9PLEO|nr:hypothetical protein CC78DRAFT_71073 [Didymosphaeria enalia]